MSATIKLESPANHKYLSVLGAAVSAFAELAGDAGLAYSVQLAVLEICANIIDHAYEAEEPHNRIWVRLESNGTSLASVIVDNGRSFDPHTLAWPLPTTWKTDHTENGHIYQLVHIEEPSLEQERGRGMFLVCELMDKVTYMPQTDQNCWRLIRQYA